MAKTLQFRRGTSAELDAITGAEGELFVDLDTNAIRVHNGNTQGGIALSTLAETEAAYTNAVADAAGATITDDTTSNTDFYPVFTNATSGDFSDATVSSTKLFFNPDSGTLNATNFNSLSDATVKTNINEISNGLDVINSVSGVEFDWKDNGNHSAGVVAQELEKILPHLVSTSNEGVKSVNYAGLTAYLLSAIQELSSKINK